MKARKLVLPLKVIGTLVLCFVLYQITDWRQLGGSLQALDWRIAVAILGAMMLGVLLSAYKWKVLLEIHGIRERLSTLNGYYFTAAFFNNFLPTSIGGDAYRFIRTARSVHARRGALAAVFMERLSGFAVLILVAFVVATVQMLRGADSISWIFVAGVPSAALAALLLLLLVWRGRLPALKARFAASLFTAARDSLEEYRRSPGRSAWGLIGLSLAFHAYAFSAYALLLYGLGGEVAWAPVVLSVAAANVAGMLPLSINGLGAMEGAFVYVWSHYGIGTEVALSAMIIIRCSNLVISAIGGIVFSTQREPATDAGRAAAQVLLKSQGP
jgi:uncharacterized protein (TIRG00374 family)